MDSIKQQQQLQNEFVQYAYVIFVTPYGKGYGCFAIKAEETTEYNINKPKMYSIASAFHAPMNFETGKVKQFDKTSLRRIATQRLQNLHTIDISLSTPYPTIKELLDAALVEMQTLPSWAERAYFDRHYFLTLKNSNMNWIQMVDKLDAYKRFIMQIYQVKDSFLYFKTQQQKR